MAVLKVHINGIGGEGDTTMLLETTPESEAEDRGVGIVRTLRIPDETGEIRRKLDEEEKVWKLPEMELSNIFEYGGKMRGTRSPVPFCSELPKSGGGYCFMIAIDDGDSNCNRYEFDYIMDDAFGDFGAYWNKLPSDGCPILVFARVSPNCERGWSPQRIAKRLGINDIKNHPCRLQMLEWRWGESVGTKRLTGLLGGNLCGCGPFRRTWWSAFTQDPYRIMGFEWLLRWRYLGRYPGRYGRRGRPYHQWRLLMEPHAKFVESYTTFVESELDATGLPSDLKESVKQFVGGPETVGIPVSESPFSATWRDLFLWMIQLVKLIRLLIQHVPLRDWPLLHEKPSYFRGRRFW